MFKVVEGQDNKTRKKDKMYICKALFRWFFLRLLFLKHLSCYDASPCFTERQFICLVCGVLIIELTDQTSMYRLHRVLLLYTWRWFNTVRLRLTVRCIYLDARVRRLLVFSAGSRKLWLKLSDIIPLVWISPDNRVYWFQQEGTEASQHAEWMSSWWTVV